MATPYLALTWMPVLLKRLPRPGVWMLRFKQVMAFPMFATCVWLVWVLAQQIGLDSLALVLIGLVLVAFAAWAYGLSQTGASAWRWVALAAAPLALFTVFASTLAGQAPSRGDLTPVGGRGAALRRTQRLPPASRCSLTSPPPGVSPARPTSGWC
jgi:thiol:disulfide interchange protein DsbD